MCQGYFGSKDFVETGLCKFLLNLIKAYFDEYVQDLQHQYNNSYTLMIFARGISQSNLFLI